MVKRTLCLNSAHPCVMLGVQSHLRFLTTRGSIALILSPQDLAGLIFEDAMQQLLKDDKLQSFKCGLLCMRLVVT